MSGGAPRLFKPDAAETVAHPVVHPTAARVLEALASSSLPLSVPEVCARSGVPRRTVYYWLRRLLERGLVARHGKPRSPGVCYSATPEGLRALQAHRSNLALSSLERVQPLFRTARKGRAELPASSALGSGPRRRVRFAVCAEVGPGRWVPVLVLGSAPRLPFLVPARAVVDGDVSGPGKLEVGFRVPWGPIRRLLGLVGAGFSARSRLRAVTVYVREGVVHADFSFPRGVARLVAPEVELLGPPVLARRALALYLVALVAASAAGWGPELLAALALSVRGVPA
jgi:DNA-binding transcriptional ArsR family regulator